ncbi:hypothetical protein ACFO5K_12725 [Nocardia halotolerans]|uniref:Uncharacterized protein n=1 Tax=Nocardia halotolerans TaxID=1755878 RepID=A0ABV8VJL5_9NOCA
MDELAFICVRRMLDRARHALVSLLGVEHRVVEYNRRCNRLALARREHVGSDVELEVVEFLRQGFFAVRQEGSADMGEAGSEGLAGAALLVAPMTAHQVLRRNHDCGAFDVT